LQQLSSGVLFVGTRDAVQNQQKHLAFLAARAKKEQRAAGVFTAEEPKHLVESQGFTAGP